MDDNSLIIAAADLRVTEINAVLSSVSLSDKSLLKSEEFGDDCLNLMDLVLQYRLDTQDALRQLCSIEHSLLQLLGVNASAGEAINLERLAYALGHDDLHYVLSRLNELVKALKRQALIKLQRDKTQHFELDKKSQNPKQSRHYEAIDKLTKALTLAREHLKSFKFELSRLSHNLEALGGEPQVGIHYDHILALKGPISRYYQAIQNGMALSHELVQDLALDHHLELSIAPILQQAREVLTPEPHNMPPLKLFQPKSMPLPNLEVRAEQRRLSQFFCHP